MIYSAEHQQYVCDTQYFQLSVMSVQRPVIRTAGHIAPPDHITPATQLTRSTSKENAQKQGPKCNKPKNLYSALNTNNSH
jgi:hypothetical protein